MTASLKGLAKTYGTTILLQHNGLPRTPFYTQRYLKGLLESLGAPSSISGQLASLRYKSSRKIQAALRGAGDYLSLQESHKRFGVELSKKLNEVLPEFGPFTTQHSYLYDEPYISDEIQAVTNRGTDRFIAVSLHPFEESHRVNLMKKRTTDALKHSFSEVIDLNSGRRTYVAKNRPISFELERIDSIGTHPSLIQYWTERLINRIPEYEALIFCVPMPSISNRYKYYENVYESVEKVMYSIFDRSPQAYCFRVAYYLPWDHSFLSFPVSKSIESQMKMLAMFENRYNLLIPFGTLFKDYDTEYILPENNKNIKLLRPDENDTNLVHSFVELIKTRILTERHESEKLPVDPLF